MARTVLVDGDHLTRLMKLCRMVNQGSGATLQTLQSKLKTSRRTVFRDLSTLQEFGITVNSTPKGYRIKENAAACKRQIETRIQKQVADLLRGCLK